MSRFEIEIRKEIPAGVSLRYVRKTAARILQELGLPQAGVFVDLVSDRKIRRLNRKYLGRSSNTDVIAFGGLDRQDLAHQGKRSYFLGDLFISVETVLRNSRRFESGFIYEFSYCLCHGLLHLLGYEDNSLGKAARMARMQRRILRKIGIREEGI